MAVFEDYKWENGDEFDVLRDKFNNAMDLADSLPLIPLGSMLPWQGNPNDLTLFDGDGIGVVGSAMANFALCLGQALTGSLLKNYDGSAKTTAPNMKGKVAVGWDVADTDYNEFAKTGGTKTHVLATSEMPAHTHNYTDYRAADSDAGGNLSGSGTDHMITQTGYTTASTSTGGGAAHENRQPFVTTGFIIRYK